MFSVIKSLNALGGDKKMEIMLAQIATSGSGVDLLSLPDGLSLKMADPVKDFKYACNAVTLTYDLSQYS